MTTTTHDHDQAHGHNQSPPLTLSYDKWSVDANTLPPKAIAYLLQNGYSQSMTDAAAFSKEQKEDYVKDHASAHNLNVADIDESTRFAIIRAAADDVRQKRHEAILKGEVGVRVGSGPRLDPLARAMRDIAEKKVHEILASKNEARRAAGQPRLEAKADVLKAAIAKVLERNHDLIKQQAEEALARRSSMVGLDDII